MIFKLNPNKLIYIIAGIFSPIVIYINRFLVPDQSFDTVNYHVFLGFKGLSNFFLPFNGREFYPSGLFSFSTFFDSINYVFINLVGYRIGNIGSLISYILIVIAVYKIVQLFDAQFFNKVKLKNIILFVSIVTVHELLFEVATYFVEGVSTALVLWGFLLLFTFYKKVIDKKNYSKIDLFKFLLGNILIGISVYGKQTNLMYLPACILVNTYIAWILFRVHYGSKKIFVHLLFLPNLALFGFVSIYGVINYLETKNPFFPFYNAIFKSEYYPPISFENRLFGGLNFPEKVLWPIVSFFQPERLGEVHDMFNDYKLNIYIILSVLILIFLKKVKTGKFEKLFILVFITSALFWSFMFGYVRYATALEIIGGLTLLLLVNKKVLFFNSKPAVILLLIFLIFQNIRIIKFNLTYDYSWRPTINNDWLVVKQQLPYLFAKEQSLPDEIAVELRAVDLTLNCSHPHTLYQTLSPLRGKPTLLIDNSASGGLTSTKQFQLKSQSMIDLKVGQRYGVIVPYFGLSANYEKCVNAIKQKGYTIAKEYNIDNFLGSTSTKLKIILGEIR